MIRAEALARGRLFSRFLILLAALLATFALIADAMAAGVVEPIVVHATSDGGGLYLPMERFQPVLPEPLEGWEVAVQTDRLFSLFDPAGWPFSADGVPRDVLAGTTTTANLTFGGLCFLTAGLLLWVARRRPRVV